MTHRSRRFFGIALISAAVAGLIISVLGLAGAWIIKKPLTIRLSAVLELTDSTLQTTADGLAITSDSLRTATINLNSLRSTLLATGRAINSTTPMVMTLSTVMGEELPNTILATQNSLHTAQTSARLIENILTIVTSIPFVPGDPYRPEVPLHVALGEVSKSLDPLIDSFTSIESGLNSTRGNLILIETEFTIMARQVNQINDSLDSARKVISQYQKNVTDLQESIHKIQEGLPLWMNLAALFFSFWFIWLSVTQIGLLIQGMDMLWYTPFELRG